MLLYLHKSLGPRNAGAHQVKLLKLLPNIEKCANVSTSQGGGGKNWVEVFSNQANLSL